MQKKTKRKLYTTNNTTDFEYGKIIKITIGVVLILALTYLITGLATGEIKFGKEKETEEETSIQYEEILAGQIFNRNSEEYYVLLFNFTDNFASYYLSLKDTYVSSDGSLPFYIVDLEKKSNKDIVVGEDESVKTNVSSVSDLKVSNPTILKIKNHKVVDTIEGRENILKFFSE